jgi:hypothetical protein
MIPPGMRNGFSGFWRSTKGKAGATAGGIAKDGSKLSSQRAYGIHPVAGRGGCPFKMFVIADALC